MVIDMNEAQVCTLEQVREVVAGTQVLEFRPGGDDAARYAWIESVLRRFSYRSLKRAHHAVLWRVRFSSRLGSSDEGVAASHELG